MNVITGQCVQYDFGSNSYTGKVVDIFDDFYIVRGPRIGRVRVDSNNNFFRYSMDPYVIRPLLKNGSPVMSKKFWLF